eukprot:m.327396 g.327396  ORF g.327396 m.327396 type:complete len:653 (+) comp16025_c0_seq3:244-2202(+)
MDLQGCDVGGKCMAGAVNGEDTDVDVGIHSCSSACVVSTDALSAKNKGTQLVSSLKLKAIAAGSFYGKAKKPKTEQEAKRDSVWKARRDKLVEAAKEYMGKPYIQPEHVNLLAPTALWETFPTQQQAFDFSASLRSGTRIFAYEPPGSSQGKKRYLVSNDTFWTRYSLLPPASRHHYELIRQTDPCHLYLDLEFNKVANPHRDGPAMCAALINYVCLRVLVEYGKATDAHQAVILESSTATKFSRHVILHVPCMAFDCNRHVGSFVRCLVMELELYMDKYGYDGSQNTVPATHLEEFLCSTGVLHRAQAQTSRIQMALVKVAQLPNIRVWDKVSRKQDGECDRPVTHVQSDRDGELHSPASCQAQLTSFVDLGVYSKNRLFRLFLSSKIDKQVHLEVSEDCSFPFQQVSLPPALELFRQDTQCDDHLLKVFVASLVALSFSPDVQLVRHDKSVDEGPTLRPASKSPCPVASKAAGASISVPAQHRGGYAASPFPSIDEFICQLASGFGKAARIRRWRFFETSKVVTFDISGSRFCHRVKRHHKSNGIYFIVHLDTAMVAQRCYDPDCRGFQSGFAKLPAHVYKPPDEQPLHNVVAQARSRAANPEQRESHEEDDQNEADDFLQTNFEIVELLCEAAETGCTVHDLFGAESET